MGPELPEEWLRLADGSAWNRRSLYLAALELCPGYGARNGCRLSYGASNAR